MKIQILSCLAFLRLSSTLALRFCGPEEILNPLSHVFDGEFCENCNERGVLCCLSDPSANTLGINVTFSSALCDLQYGGFRMNGRQMIIEAEIDVLEFKIACLFIDQCLQVLQ